MERDPSVFTIAEDIITFHYLTDIGALNGQPQPVELPASNFFEQGNEPSGLRSIESLEDVCTIAREAAAETKRLFDLTT